MTTDTLATAPAAPARRHAFAIWQRVLIGLLLLLLIAGGGAWLMHASIDPAEDASSGTREGPANLSAVRSWGYQLQRVDLDHVAKAAHHLMVLDHSLDGRSPASAQRKVPTALKRHPDGGRRLVLSYLSIGEAEVYRSYWRSAWAAPAPIAVAAAPGSASSAAATPEPARAARFQAPTWRPPLVASSAAPAWLGRENPEWPGNFAVRFWLPDWQQIVFGTAESQLDAIIAAGFDGIYLDRADVYASWQAERLSAKADMVEFVARLAEYARAKKPGFLVVMQNAEELLTSPRLRGALDAVAKEDLFYGIDGEGRENSASDVDSSLKYLRLARDAGLPVLVVEYTAEPAKVAKVRERAAAEGLVPYFAPRLLNALAAPG